jgi:hypothetical protein
MHTYLGLLAKIFGSSESDSAGNSHNFVVGWSSHSSLSSIGYLALQKRLKGIIKSDFTYVNGKTGSPILAFTWGEWPCRVSVLELLPFE